MSIETELIAAKGYIEDCYDAVEDLQGTVPQNKNLSNLPAAINTISQSQTIVQGIPTYQIQNDGTAVDIGTTSYVVPDDYFKDITEIGEYALSWYGVKKNINIFNKIDFRNLVTIGEGACTYAFADCTNITSVDMGSLINIPDIVQDCVAMFYNCTGITTVDLHSLVNGGDMSLMFSGCSSLTSVNLNSLQTIVQMQQCFSETNLQTISFPSLTTVSQSNCFIGLFRNCFNLTAIHFRADVQSTIEGLMGYSDKFGATNATIYFDL